MTVTNSLIAGPGSIGSLVCAQAQTLGPVRVFKHRPNIGLAKSLLIRDKATSLKWLVDEETHHTPDVIWVTCKAFDVLETSEKLIKRFPASRIILMNNGMGPQQTLAAKYPNNIIIASTTCGALKTADKTYTQTSFGETQLQLPQNDTLFQTISKIAQYPPLNIQLIDDIEPILWRKLLVNTCINPLTASLMIKNGQLLTHDLRQEIKAIIKEFNSVYQAVKQARIDNSLELIANVIQISRNNWSSMAMDVKQGRRTEIEFINGFLLNQANKQNLHLPRIQFWYEQIASLQKY